MSFNYRHARKLLSSMAAALLVCTTSCSDDTGKGLGQTGKVNLRLDIDRSAKAATPSRSTLGELAAAVTAQEFNISLINEVGDEKTWSYNDFNGANISTGKYTLMASSGKKGAEGFNAPYFEGTTNVQVFTDETTEASVTARLANAGVVVKYSDNFKNYLTDYVASVRTAGNSEGYDYPADASEELFVTPGETSLYVSFTTPQGQSATLKAAEFTAVAQHVYTVTVDVNNGQMGDPVLSVSFDDTTVAEEVEFVLSDELLNAPAPTVTPADAVVDVIETAAAPQTTMTINARGGLAEVNMITEGASLAGNVWPDEIDLLKASEAQKQTLTGKGLSVMGLWRNPDKMAVLDFTNVIPQLAPGTMKVSIEVVDKYGKVTETNATLTINVEPLSFMIDSAAPLAIDDDRATISITYNGGDPAKDLNITYQNDRGTTTTSTILNVEKIADKKYNVTFSIPANDQPIKITVKVGTLAPVTYTLQRVNYRLAVNTNNVFATYATAVMTSDDVADDIANSLYSVSTDNGATWYAAKATYSGDRVTFSDLTPGTPYTVRAMRNGVAVRASFTTEAAAQLPNGDMETWYNGHYPSGLNYYSLWYAGEGADAAQWGTNNPMTTSEGAGYQYVRTSGTMPDDGGRNGKCALLCTVGWGSGNTATSSNGGSGKMNYADAGLLHLGSSRTSRPSDATGHNGTLDTSDLDCGLAFGSRPSSIGFWYKYTPKNGSDQGFFEFWVKDAAGNVIASGTRALPSTSNWAEVTLPITYPWNTAKGARIYVKFLSTNDASFLTQSNNNFSGPGFANLSNGRYLGSQLFIDDITLTY